MSDESMIELVAPKIPTPPNCEPSLLCPTKILSATRALTSVTPPLPFPAPSAPAPPAGASRQDTRSGEPANGGSDDLDGARLIALNMALNGDSRAATDRFLAEHYELADRQKLLDEVFAAVEG